MLGQAAPFLGQGGIDPRMVSGPSSDFMTQMASLPIQSQQPWRQAAMRLPGGGFQSGGMVNGEWQPNPGQGGQFYGSQAGGFDPMMRSIPADAARMSIDNGQTQGPWGGQAGGGMPSYLGGGMEQPFQRMATAFPGGGGPGNMQGRQQMPPQAQIQQMLAQRRVGPGQQVTAEQLAARGLNPQEIQRRLQQFAGGQLGWQGQQGGGGQGGGQMPGQPDMNDPRVQDFIRRMTGNPAAGGPGGGQDPYGLGPVTPYGPAREGIRRMVPQQNPRQGMPRPPAGPDYGNDMIARPIPPQSPPMRPGTGRPAAGEMPRSNRQQRMGG